MASINVTIRPLSSSAFPLAIPRKGPISAIRSLLQTHASTSGSDLRLIFNKKVLTDSLSIESVGITTGAVIYVMCMMTAGFDIIVTLLTGKKIVIGVSKSDSMIAVKGRIQDKEGIPPDEQILMCRERELRDSETVESCGIEAETNLYLQLRASNGNSGSEAVEKAREEGKTVTGWNVTVRTFADETFSIAMNSQQVSGLRLKEAIYQSKQIPIVQQRLYTQKREVTDTTNLNLAQATPVLVITPNDCVKVQTPTLKLLTAKLTDGLTVSSIIRSIEAIKGWACINFRLALNSRVLVDRQELLTELTHRSILQIKLPWKLYMRDLAGCLCAVSVYSSDTVQSLQEKLTSEFQIKPKMCKLSFQGKALTDGYLAIIWGQTRKSVVHFDGFFQK